MSYFKKTQLLDNYGWSPEFTPMDELRSVHPVRLAGAVFTGTTVDTKFWAVTNANGGTTTQANNNAILATNTTANGSTILQSVRLGRYVGGSANRFRAVIQLGDTGTANNERRWGMFNGTDGAYFKINGTTVSVCTMKTGSETAVASASWNGSTTVPTLTNANTYEIYATNTKVYFIIGGVLVHTVTASSATWSDTCHLPSRIDNTNSGGATANVTINVRAATIYRLGDLMTQVTSTRQSGTTAANVCKYGPGNLHSLLIGNVSNTAAITLYDNTAASGTILYTTGSMPNGTAPFQVNCFSLPFAIGLTLVVATANCDVTVVYE